MAASTVKTRVMHNEVYDKGRKLAMNALAAANSSFSNQIISMFKVHGKIGDAIHYLKTGMDYSCYKN